MEGELLFTAGLLVLLAVASAAAAVRLGLPALVAFLVLGMLTGSDGPGVSSSTTQSSRDPWEPFA